MSKDDLSVAQAAMTASPDPGSLHSSQDCSDACHRLLDAMDDLAHAKANWRDVAGLTRQVLLTSVVTYGGNPRLAVPTAFGWPTPEQWGEVHCSSLPVSGGRLSVKAL